MITINDVRAVALAIVEREGTDHYNPAQYDVPENGYDYESGMTCVYTSEGGKHCIAGQILVDLGKPVPSFQSEYSSTMVTHLFEVAPYASYYKDIEPAAMYWIQAAQYAADGGNSWGRCVEIADEEANHKGWFPNGQMV